MERSRNLARMSTLLASSLSLTGAHLCEIRLARRLTNDDATDKLERVKGIEPSYAAWEAAVLPLNYTRTIRFC